MKKTLLICFLIIANLSYAYSQTPTKFHITGYKVIFVPSDVFDVQIGNPNLGEKKIEGNTLRLEIIDKEGRFPKDTVYIYTNNIESIYAQQSQIYFKEEFKLDSLSVKGVSFFGEIDVACNKLTLNLAAASSLTVKGETDMLVCNVRAASSCYADQLYAQKGYLNISNKGRLTANIQDVINIEKTEDSSFSNVYH